MGGSEGGEKIRDGLGKMKKETVDMGSKGGKNKTVI